MDTAAGCAVSEPDIPVLILGDASHPAIGGIRGEGSLLIHGYAARWVIKLIPADRHLAGAGLNSVVYHRPIMIGEVSNSKAVHDSIAERVERLRCSKLWNAGAARPGEVRHADGRRGRESGRGRREVHRECTEVQLAGTAVLPRYVQSGRPVGWSSRAIH